MMMADARKETLKQFANKVYENMQLIIFNDPYKLGFNRKYIAEHQLQFFRHCLRTDSLKTAYEIGLLKQCTVRLRRCDDIDDHKYLVKYYPNNTKQLEMKYPDRPSTSESQIRSTMSEIRRRTRIRTPKDYKCYVERMVTKNEVRKAIQEEENTQKVNTLSQSSIRVHEDFADTVASTIRVPPALLSGNNPCARLLGLDDHNDFSKDVHPEVILLMDEMLKEVELRNSLEYEKTILMKSEKEIPFRKTVIPDFYCNLEELDSEHSIPTKVREKWEAQKTLSVSIVPSLNYHPESSKTTKNTIEYLDTSKPTTIKNAIQTSSKTRKKTRSLDTSKPSASKLKAQKRPIILEKAILDMYKKRRPDETTRDVSSTETVKKPEFESNTSQKCSTYNGIQMRYFKSSPTGKLELNVPFSKGNKTSNNSPHSKLTKCPETTGLVFDHLPDLYKEVDNDVNLQSKAKKTGIERIESFTHKPTDPSHSKINVRPSSRTTPFTSRLIKMHPPSTATVISSPSTTANVQPSSPHLPFTYTDNIVTSKYDLSHPSHAYKICQLMELQKPQEAFFFENGKSSVCDGTGLFALKKFQQGEYVIELTGTLLSYNDGIPIKEERMRQQRDKEILPGDYMFCFTSMDGISWMIDGTEGDNSRFINHGGPQRANIKPRIFRVPLEWSKTNKNGPIHRVFFEAIKDIEAAEELLFDYKDNMEWHHQELN